MVESLLLHKYSFALSATFSSTVTIRCVFHVNCTALVTHTEVERHNAIRSRAQLAAVTQPLCSASSAHHAATADASTQLSISEFLQFCLTKHPFRRTVPLRVHDDLREAQTPSNTGNAMAATFADAATQLSFAEFLERCNLSSALPPRPQPSPPYFWTQLRRLLHTEPLLLMRPPNSRSQSSFSGASAPKTLWITRSHHRHMLMSAAPHFPCRECTGFLIMPKRPYEWRMLTAATGTTTPSLALNPVTKQLTFLFSSISAPPTYLAPTASCAVNTRSKDGLSANTTDRSEGRDYVVHRDVVYQDHVSAHLSTSSAVASESLVGQLFHTE